MRGPRQQDAESLVTMFINQANKIGFDISDDKRTVPVFADFVDQWANGNDYPEINVNIK